MHVPIIILHGWNLYGNKYLQIIKILRDKKYTVYYPDFPGFGKNNKIDRPLCLDDYVYFLNKYVSERKLKKFVFMAHSFGGRVAIKYTIKFPHQVHSLILTGVPGYVPVRSSKVLIFLILSKIGRIIFSLPMLSEYRTEMRNMLHRLARASDYNQTNGYMRDTFKTIIREDLDEDMKNIKQHTLLVWGENDRTVPVSVAYKMQKTFHNCDLLIVKNTNHRLPFQNSWEFYHTVKKYLQ